MIFEGVWFNTEWVKTKTEAEFIAHESHHGLSEKQLKEVYALIVPKKKKAKKEEVTGWMPENPHDLPPLTADQLKEVYKEGQEV